MKFDRHLDRSCGKTSLHLVNSMQALQICKWIAKTWQAWSRASVIYPAMVTIGHVLLVCLYTIYSYLNHMDAKMLWGDLFKKTSNIFELPVISTLGGTGSSSPSYWKTGPVYYTRSIQWLLMAWIWRNQGISSHSIDPQFSTNIRAPSTGGRFNINMSYPFRL